MKAFLIDVAKCNGCHNCQISCKDEHCGTEWMPYAADQPMTGHFWCKVEEKVRGSVPVVRVSYTPLVCGHCDDAPCLAAAKDGAVYRRTTGSWSLTPRRRRASAPWTPARWAPSTGTRSSTCRRSARAARTSWTTAGPSRAAWTTCPAGALSFGEEGELDLEGAEPLEALAGLGAHAWYKNLPKRFVAGCLVDFDSREVVVGAEAVLADERSGAEVALATDDFGDFLFDQVARAAYTVRIPSGEFAADVREKDLNLGDIAAQ